MTTQPGALATTTIHSRPIRVYTASDRPRPLRAITHADPGLDSQVASILEEVRRDGDAALRRLTHQFDGVELDAIRVSVAEIDHAYRQVDQLFLTALRIAIEAVTSFHERQIPDESPVATHSGVLAWRVWRPIRRVGLYVPGGRACYPSTVVMLGIPARITGCPGRALVTPPGPDGAIPPATLVAAREVGIDEIYKIGGAQAIAALAFGTETIAPVDKIFGPGNAYVTAAKLQVFPRVAIDLPAGPSELFIIADQTANPAWVAADMLANAEHGPDSSVILVTTSPSLAEAVIDNLDRQLASLPRAAIAGSALRDFGAIVLAGSVGEACDIANEYAPEHLQIMTNNAEALIDEIDAAGSVFVGHHSPNAAGDYATGTNHVLPTGGHARSFGALSVESFARMMEIQRVDKWGIKDLASVVGPLARQEGLEGHARAVDIRSTNLEPRE